MRHENLFNAEDGATSVEYAVLLAMIIMVCLLGIATFGQAQDGVWNDILDAWESFIG